VDDLGPIHLPEIGIAVSLGVIIGTLAITTVASLIKSHYIRRRLPADSE
jgi:hypothetical protein